MRPLLRWLDRAWGRRLSAATVTSAMIASVVLLGLLWGIEYRRSRARAEAFAYSPNDGGELPRLWQAPSFALVDQHHRQLTLASLRGEPFIADFIFTQCTSACPILTSRMVLLQRRLAGQDVRFVSFSVDPAHDTPDTLAAYAARWNEQETRWSLLATDDTSLPVLTKGFKVTAEKSGDERNPIVHSTLFFFVDGDGFVRGVYASDDDEALARLAADVRRLSKTASFAESPPAESKSLYASLGCAGCHENPRVAPPLVDLAGAERMLADGTKVTIDDDYLRRSILEPATQVVSGYLPLMPSYRHALSDPQVNALVAELDTRTSADAGRAQEPSVALVVDPVCHMKVRATADSPHITFQGHELYFCSDKCRDTFSKHPARYPLEPLAGATIKP